jgi:hypothetical protein
VKRDYWTDDVAALAMSTPIAEIRIDEISPDSLRRLRDVLEEMRHDPAAATDEFHGRYRELRRLLDGRDAGARAICVDEAVPPEGLEPSL